MPFAPSSSRARLCRVYVLFLLTATASHGVWAFALSGMNGVFAAVLRPQVWEPRGLILAVQEQRGNNAIPAVEEVLEAGLLEEDDFSDAFEIMFEEHFPPELPSELWVRVARSMPYATLYNAVQSRVLGIGEALCALDESAREHDRMGRRDSLIACLQEALGLLYGRPECNQIKVLDGAVLDRFAGDIYGVHLTGENAISESIGVDLYHIWVLVLLNASMSESREVRSRAYCELGFVLRLNVLARQDVWLERVYQALFDGLDALGYSECLSLFAAFEHSLTAGVYAERVKTLAFGCLVAMALKPEAQLLVGDIGRVLVNQYERGLLSSENAEIVDRLFIHPEKLFRFNLM